MAAQWAVEKESHSKDSITFADALENYIVSKSNVLSPATIRGYRSLQRVLKAYSRFMETMIENITQEQVQVLINDYAMKHTPKTTKNVHGLISAVLKTYNPSLALHTTLPQKIAPELYIPTDEDVKKLISAIDDEDLLIAVLLAAFGPMRRSEICGLKSSDIDGNTVHVQRALVMDEKREWALKTTKTVAGNRYIPLPDFVFAKIRDKDGTIVNLNPTQISHRFTRVLKRCGLPHFRFHDLRHYCASIQHALGIPDAYIMERGGWSTDSVLKQIYRHALSDKSVQMNEKANEHFKSLMG
jgi:integrase